LPLYPIICNIARTLGNFFSGVWWGGFVPDVPVVEQGVWNKWNNVVSGEKRCKLLFCLYYILYKKKKKKEREKKSAMFQCSSEK
jgi:hypothetical protein